MHDQSFRQPDPFGDPQRDLFAATKPAQPVAYRGDPERVRAQLTRILAEARAAKTAPWSRNDKRMYETIVPQMTNWLPQDEAARWCREFACELARLQADGDRET